MYSKISLFSIMPADELWEAKQVLEIAIMLHNNAIRIESDEVISAIYAELELIIAEIARRLEATGRTNNCTPALG